MFTKKKKETQETTALPKASVAQKKKEAVRAIEPWMHAVLKKPVVTEKALLAQGELKKVQFMVALDANKIQIAQAVQAIYGVGVEAVRVVRMQGKLKMRAGRKGKRSDYKKAIITLVKGASIDVHRGV